MAMRYQKPELFQLTYDDEVFWIKNREPLAARAYASIQNSKYHLRL